MEAAEKLKKERMREEADIKKVEDENRLKAEKIAEEKRVALEKTEAETAAKVAAEAEEKAK